MSERLKRNLKFIKTLKSCKNRKTLLLKASNDSIASLVESVANILRGKVRLSGRDIRKLSKSANILRKVAKTRSALSARKIFVQSGAGFLPILLPIIISAASSIVSKLLNSSSKR